MILSTQYYTLIGSLPALPASFEDAERVPISRFQLTERLKMLKPKDAQVIDEMAEFLVWERQPLERTNEDMVRHYEKFMKKVGNAFARDLIRNTMTVRTIVSGLRSRRMDLEPPHGIPPISARIVRNWSHPDFRLGGRYPWIADVERQLNSDSPFDLERTRFGVRWRHARWLAEQHRFTFEAVVLYLIRWELVFRWTQRNAETGRKKFEQLVTDAMGDFANMFAERPDRRR